MKLCFLPLSISPSANLHLLMMRFLNHTGWQCNDYLYAVDNPAVAKFISIFLYAKHDQTYCS